MAYKLISPAENKPASTPTAAWNAKAEGSNHNKVQEGAFPVKQDDGRNNVIEGSNQDPDGGHADLDETIAMAADSETDDQADLEQLARDGEGGIEEEPEATSGLGNFFRLHFEEPPEEEVTRRSEAIENSSWKSERIAINKAKTIVTVPSTANTDVPSLPSPAPSVGSLPLKKRLHDSAKAAGMGNFDEEDQSFASILFSYRDILYCKRNYRNAPNLRKLLCLHVLNHIFNSRDRILKNNEKIRRAGENSIYLDCKDQGFTRPSVLFLLPTRESCVRMVSTLVSLVGDYAQEYRERFDESFIDKEVKFRVQKPADFLDLFEGNDDDNFRIGIRLVRKTIHFYAPFYTSDIIMASPLGLRIAMSGDKMKDKEPDHEYLSSIEIIVVDQADALLMQNWEHVEHIFEHLNLVPEKDHGNWGLDRVRSWYLEKKARHFRQSVILSQFNTPDLIELQRLHSLNWEGKVRMQLEYAGEIHKVGIKLRQSFTRFHSSSVAHEPEARFKYFTATIIPMLAKKSKKSAGTLIFIPSYVEYVRVRNFFASATAASAISFGTVSEYAEIGQSSRAISHFRTGRHRVLLYTERAHHFRRRQIPGVKRVIMYGLPDNPIFYREVVGYMAKSEASGMIDSGEGNVRAIFSKYDVLKLERIVGSSRVRRMVNDRGDVFDFV